MSELKWKWAYFPWLDDPEKQRESAVNVGYVKVVLKSEADEVITELKDKLRHYPLMVAMLEYDKLESLHYVHKIRHHKYKRCLAMAKLCHWKAGVFLYKKEKSDFYWRWYKRWLTIAIKFRRPSDA